MWKNGLILAVILALTLGIVFAAPGAVYVAGRNITVRQNGIISLAGPVTNLMVVFLFGMLFAVFGPVGFLKTIILFTMQINFFLAAFNMIPILPLDGSKVFMWNKGAWLVTTVVAAAGVLFFPYIVALLAFL